MSAVLNLHSGDCLKVLDEMEPESFDAVVSDPPYHLESIVKRFGKANSAPAKQGRDGGFARASSKFMGKTWDGGDIAFRAETWAKIARVLKPGGHVLAFNHASTYHRMAVGMEDGGLEIRDMLAWVYATGLPKNHPLEKSLAKIGATQEEIDLWAQYGTTLKPCLEPIALARKPIAAGSIPRQVLATGTGALNLGATAIPNLDARRASNLDPIPTRYPGNLVHDGSPEVRARFPVAQDGLSASRFFYCPKANKADRHGSDHPTVKPQALMEWLIKLVAPTGARILDPFGGSGATAWAAHALGVDCDLVERDPEYQADIARGISRLAAMSSDPEPLPDALLAQASLFPQPTPKG